MAEEEKSNDDRTEEASPERREEFRERGQIAVSRELTSVAVLAAVVGLLIIYVPHLTDKLQKLIVGYLQSISDTRISSANFSEFFFSLMKKYLVIILPLFAVSSLIAIAVTMLQTKFNWSWKRIKPDFSRLNPIKGMARFISMSSLVELTKGIMKLSAVGVVSYFILEKVWSYSPSLLNMPLGSVWGYWGSTTQKLFWQVSILLLVVAILDYGYNFFTLEKKMKMTKQEVKEELKRREVDPHIKARIKRMQRDLSTRRMLDATRNATVIVTNPEHFAVALKYELGMPAPVVIAKGMDFLAQRMKVVARENDIPIVENKPLARTLYKITPVGATIPESLYKTVSGVIKYVFKLKGIKIGSKKVTV